MARRKRVVHPKLTPALRDEILHLVQTWQWRSVQGLKTRVPTPVVGRDIPPGSTSPSIDWLNRWDFGYEDRLALCQTTLDKLDALGGGDWPRVTAALQSAWNFCWDQACSDPDWLREQLEERDLVKKKLREGLKIGDPRTNPNLQVQGPWTEAVREFLNDPRVNFTPGCLRRAGRRPPKPWREPPLKALHDAGVPA